MANEHVSVKCNNDDEIIELNNENNNEIINERNTALHENNEQLPEPTVTKRDSSSTIEHNEPNITLRRSNRTRNKPNYLKDYI